MKKTIITLIALILLIMLASRAEATTYFSDDFESGGPSNWGTFLAGDGGFTPRVQSLTTSFGNYAAQLQTIAQYNSWSEMRQSLGSSYPTVYHRAYVRFTSFPASGNYSYSHVEIRGNDPLNDTLVMISLYNNSGTYQWVLTYTDDTHAPTPSTYLRSYSSTPTITINTWYCIETMVTVHASAGIVKCWIVAAGGSITEGSPTLSASGLANDDIGQAQSVVDGTWVPDGLDFTIQFDNVVVANAYIGTLANSAASTDNTIKGTGSTSATFGLNATNSSDTSFLYVRNDGNVGISNTSPGSALDVKGTLRFSGSAAGYSGLAPQASAGSTTYTLPSTSGAYGQVLSTNGSGTLTWVNPPSYDFVVTHTEGSVAPVSKTVTYRTVTTDLSGANHIWIQQNLGADAPAGDRWDASPGDAGWYWQFNRKQGYADGPIPAWGITYINEDLNWSYDQDPCGLLLGPGWRLPTYAEWNNARTIWPQWSFDQDGYDSCLRLHTSGWLFYNDGSVQNRGPYGVSVFWSSNDYDDESGYGLEIMYYDCRINGTIYDDSPTYKANGYNVRCLR